MLAHSSKKTQTSQRPMLRVAVLLFALLLPVLACDFGKEEPLWVPENPRQYTAEVPPVEVYVLIDEAGNVVDFGGPYAYGVTANMRYVLRFWDAGNRVPGYEAATIYRVYTPIRITAINADIEEGMSEEQKADVYARTSFPSTEVKLHDLTFSGGPEGTFIGTNSETGKPIYGHMEWREKEWEMHVVFTQDIQQDYLVIDEEPFYNWP
jgi:hypothetical protein